MAIFNIPGVNLQPGAERVSPAQDPPDTCTKLKVQLTDAGGTWDTTPGTILRWGIQTSDASGTNWSWQNEGCVFQDALPFGSRDRSGGMPSLLIQKASGAGQPAPVAPAGVKLRLAIEVDTAIELGAQIRTNADA